MAKQNEVNKSQADYMLSKENPKIKVNNFRYINNGIKLDLKNEGKTEARYIVLSSSVDLIKPKVISKDKQLFASAYGNLDYEKQISIKVEDEIYSLKSAFVRIFPCNRDCPELNAGEKAQFKLAMINFGLFSKKNSSCPERYYNFEELMKLLKENEVISCEISFKLLYKNINWKTVDSISLDRFYIIINNVQNKKLSELGKKDKLNGGSGLEIIDPYKKFREEKVNLCLMRATEHYDEIKINRM